MNYQFRSYSAKRGQISDDYFFAPLALVSSFSVS